jgi:hypothetical protein
MQIERLLAGSPATVDDLDDAAFALVAATLPRAQRCADGVTAVGLEALGLPDAYPRDAQGREIAYEICQSIGQAISDRGLRGVWCRSACTSDGRGRELAWFPAGNRSKGRPVWRYPLPFGAWRHAATWGDIGFEGQAMPSA